MFFLLTRRVVRQSVGPSVEDQYAARQDSFHSLTWSGPFTSRATAEQAASAALYVQTCLSAHIYNRMELTLELQHTQDQILQATAAEALRFGVLSP